MMSARAATSELFPNLPDSARLWGFGVSRSLLEEEERRLLDEVDAFLDRWRAHGHPLAAAREWLYGRFLLVGVDDTVTPPSGCSIDALVRRLREIEEDMGLQIVGAAPIWYRDPSEGEPVRVSRAEFKDMVAAGALKEDTIVFDLSLTRVGEVREGKWEAPAGRSWHRRYFE
jgi:hypothetical protein